MKRFRLVDVFVGGGGALSLMIGSSEGKRTICSQRRSKRAAFTLAEVLITLGIIGVVAALTMPALISHYQKQVWVTQLKKDVNYVQNSFRTILGNEGVESLKQTPLFVSGNSFSNDKLKEYLKEEYISESNQFMLRDGSCISFSCPSNISALSVNVDVNCGKKPNISGRDRFTFYIGMNGMMFKNNDFFDDPLKACTFDEDEFNSNAQSADPDYGFCTSWYQDNYCWGFCNKEANEYCSKFTIAKFDNTRRYGCFLKILQDGWQMKY